MKTKHFIGGIAVVAMAFSQIACKPSNKSGSGGSSELAGDSAQKVYVATGTHD